MEDLLHQLPAWGAVLVVVVYIVVKEVVPRINRASRERHERRDRHSPSPSIPPHRPFHMPLHAPAPDAAIDLAASVHKHMDRFEVALEKHFESDKQPFELLRMAVAQLEIQGHTLQEVAQALQEVKGALRVLNNTQDALLRRILEDTGRFNRPLDPRG